MPAEWEPHASTWLAWPHYRGDWPGKFEPIPWVYAEIIRHLGRDERIDLIVKNPAAEKQARKVLAKANALSENIAFHRWPTNRVWTRDSGCTFVVEARSGLSSRAKSRDLVLSPTWPPSIGASTPGQIPQLPARRKNRQPHGQNCRCRLNFAPVHGKSRVVLEGGSIDVNGRGTLLTTEECLLSKTQQRNPAMSRRDYEKRLQIIWELEQ